MTSRSALSPKLPRVTRREAAKILGTSYDNVRRMQRIGHLRSTPDRNGVHRFDRREVEALANTRSADAKLTPEKVREVFALFKANAEVADVVLAANLLPHVVRGLHEEFLESYDYGKSESRKEDDARAQREHDEQIREMDRELERRRRAVLVDASPGNKARRR